MKTQEQIKEFLEGLCDNDILNIWNEIAGYDGSVDMMFYMDELDDVFYGMLLSEFLSKMDSDFNFNDSYFYDSIWGIASTDDIYDVIDLDELAERLADNWDVYDGYIYNSELADFMDEEEEE